MLFRLTQKMAKKIKESPSLYCPADSNPYIDWSAHLFTAQRAQYIIITNSTSLYSIILHGRGITDDAAFIDHAMSGMADFMCRDGYEFQFRRLIAPNATDTVFVKLSDRRVLGSMNDLIRMAKWHLAEGQLSPFEAAEKINKAPMSYLDYDHPRWAFPKMQLETYEDKEI